MLILKACMSHGDKHIESFHLSTEAIINHPKILYCLRKVVADRFQSIIALWLFHLRCDVHTYARKSASSGACQLQPVRCSFGCS